MCFREMYDAYNNLVLLLKIESSLESIFCLASGAGEKNVRLLQCVL